MKKIFWLGLSFVYSNFGFAQNLSPLDTFVHELQSKYEIPGIAVGVLKDGKLIYSKGFGYRDREKKLKVTPHTLFGLGSTTKAFTGVTVGMMVDAGKMTWDDPIKNLMPDFVLSNSEATARSTARDLLTHNTGQGRHDLMWLGTPFSRAEIFRRLQYLEANLHFRQQWQYNNLMFMTAGHLAESLAKKSWESLIADRIFAPLRMRESNTSTTTSQLQSDFAVPYTDHGSQIIRRNFRVLDNMGPAGSINTNITDMAEWLKFQLTGRTPSGDKIVSDAVLAETHRPQIDLPHDTYDGYSEFTKSQYAFGWIVQRYRGTLVIRHEGSIGGFLATVTTVPELNAGIVVLQNVDHFDANNFIALRAYDLLLGKAPIDWVARLVPKGNKHKSQFMIEEEEKFAPIKNTFQEDPKATPSLPLSHYTGTFEDRGYGSLKIALNKGKLNLAYNDWNVDLVHKDANTFVVDGKFAGDVNFSTTTDGIVNSVSLPLEPTVSAIIFSRQK